jgi:hypothetical protein
MVNRWWWCSFVSSQRREEYREKGEWRREGGEERGD